MESLSKIAAQVGQPRDLQTADLRSAQDRASFRLRRVSILLGCYRKDDATNPEIYSAAIGAVFEDFSDEVVEYVTDPRTGLASKCQWLPTVKEVKDACQEAADRIADEIRRKRDLEQQMRERAKFEAEQAAKRNRTPEEQARVDAQIAEAKRMFAAETPLKSRAPDNSGWILAEYRAAGIEPHYTSDGKLISLSLVRHIEERKASAA